MGSAPQASAAVGTASVVTDSGNLCAPRLWKQHRNEKQFVETTAAEPWQPGQQCMHDLEESQQPTTPRFKMEIAPAAGAWAKDAGTSLLQAGSYFFGGIVGATGQK